MMAFLQLECARTAREWKLDLRDCVHKDLINGLQQERAQACAGCPALLRTPAGDEVLGGAVSGVASERFWVISHGNAATLRVVDTMKPGI